MTSDAETPGDEFYALSAATDAANAGYEAGLRARQAANRDGGQVAPAHLTHRDLAGLCAALYGGPGIEPVEWLYRSNLDANVHMGIVRRGRYLITTTRGSFNKEDWINDFRILKMLPPGRPEFGSVHKGMYLGTPEAWDIVDWHLEDGDLAIFSGHSLGADRATMLAAHMVAHGRKPHFVCTWGEPAGGTEALRALLAGVPSVRYRNTYQGRVDRVTQSTLPFGYLQSGPLTDVSAPPDQPNPFDPFELHHFALYAGATPATVIQ